METELAMQNESTKKFSINEFRKDLILSKYAQIDTDEELFIDPKDIQLGTPPEEMIVGNIDPVNKEDLSGPISIESSKKYIIKKIGKSYFLFGDRKGDPLLIIGPDWIKFILISFLINLIFFYFCKKKWNDIGGVMKFFGILVYLSYFTTYFYTELINQGFPKHNLESKTGEPRSRHDYCTICKMWINKEKKAKHCEKCGICIEGYLNHYKWMSKCIGRNNLMIYYIFIGSFAFIILFIFCILATKNNKTIENTLEKK